MKRAVSFRLFVLAALLMSTLFSFAQFPGGGGPPGGRPPGGRPPQGRFPGGDRQWDQQNVNKPVVKQKKRVREGDTFTVVGMLLDIKTNEPLPFVNLAVLDSIDSISFFFSFAFHLSSFHSYF